jgi:hypothetical protein
MREFTKALTSFSWVMSVFGVQQMGNLLGGRGADSGLNTATRAFEAVTRSTEAQFGDTLGETFRATDRLQRGMVDMMFGLMGGWASGQGRGGADGMRGVAEDMRRVAEGMTRWGDCCGPARPDAARRQQAEEPRRPQDATGWGPIPPGQGL